MYTIVDNLTHRTWRELKAFALALNLPFNCHHDKAQARRRLTEQLLMGGTLKAAFKRLANDERTALLALQTVGGKMPLCEFCNAFGMLRPYRPWNRESPQYPWKRPVSITEKLWYSTLIIIENETVFLPAEVADLLPPLPVLEFTSVTTNTMDMEINHAANLLVDLAHFLGELHGHTIRVRWNRWLSPRWLQHINARLLEKDPALTGTTIRSELHTTRLRFLHYLLEVAGLITQHNGYLKPSVQCWQWLSQPSEMQWQTLVNSIETDLHKPDPLWYRYQLSTEFSAPLFHILLREISQVPSNTTFTLTSLISVLRLHLPFDSLNGLPSLFDHILPWLGILVPNADDTYSVVGIPPYLPSVQSASLEQSADKIILTLPNFPALGPLVKLSEWVDFSNHQSTIATNTMRRVTETGKPLMAFVHTLSALLQVQLPIETLHLLQRWSHEGRRLILQTVTLVESPEPSLLASLMSERRIRPLLDKPISPHHIVVKSSCVNELVHALERRDLPIADERSALAVREYGHTSAMLDIDIAAQLWLAGTIYQALSTVIRLPITLPGSTLDWLRAQLPDKMQQLLPTQANEVINELKRHYQDSSPDAANLLPMPLKQDEMEQIRNAVEDAYHKRVSLVIDYFALSEGVTSRRTIAPTMPIIRRNGYEYVEAWCQTAEAERTFRLDRILRVITDGNA